MPNPRDHPPAKPQVFVLDDEYEALADLVCASPRATAGIALLWAELDRAVIVGADRAPDDLVRMGSRARFTDLSEGRAQTVRLVYPDQASGRGKVAVTSSLGAALIGLKPGGMFHWTDSDGRRRTIQVDTVEPPPAGQSQDRLQAA